MTGVPANAGLLPERVEKAAQERIEAGTYQTLVFGVVDGGKSEVQVFGVLDDGKAPDGDTVYEIGSITKTFTAALLAQAVLSGRVTLDTPVAQLLPDFNIPSRGGKEITLGALATHRSGLPRMPSNLHNPFGGYDSAKLKAFLAGYKLPRDPDAAYEYSNLGFGLLGYALAQSEQTTYGAMSDKEIFMPLGMTMSGTVLTDAMRAHLAPPGKAARNLDFGILAGAGAILSTANDMLRYLKADMGVDPAPLAAAMKFAQQPRRDIGKAARIGLAWMTTKKGIVWHDGSTDGYTSFLGFTADGRRGVVVFTNTDANVDDLGLATLDGAATLAATFKAIVLPGAALDEYVGAYKLADKFVLTVFRTDDGLSAQATGQGAFPIFPSAPNEFFAKVAGISISFTRDSDGAVKGLVLHQNGDRAAPKLSASKSPLVVLDDYVGTYKLADEVLLKVFRTDEGLFAEATGQDAFPIFPSAPNEFFAKVAGIGISFTRDTNGVVSGLVLHQNGDTPAPKLSASELPPELREIALDAATLGGYTGKYQFDFGVVLDLALKSGHLEAQLTGQSAFPIFASARDRFFYMAANAQLTFERDAGGKVIAVVLHQNGRDMRAPRMTAQMSAFERPREAQEIALDAATLGDYAGKYRFDFGAILDVTLRSGHLEAQLAGQYAFPIFASARDRFFYKVVDAQLAFERDAGGKVIAVVLHQNGRDMRAPRMATQP
jgi:CubicO group peptidase (beta-lactamase class C family)